MWHFPLYGAYTINVCTVISEHNTPAKGLNYLAQLSHFLVWPGSFKQPDVFNRSGPFSR